MITFITFLRALAACLITNSHYNGVYPLDFIANGGLVGNAVFCAVSGYCLYHVKGSFPKWYGKRLFRCYLPVWVITAVYVLLGFFSLSDKGFLYSFCYPTRYHFISTIVILYIPFYIVMKWSALRNNLPKVMLSLGAVALLYYLFFFDKTYYHIEDVRGLLYRATLFASMLLGAWFRQSDDKYRNRLSKWHFLPVPILFGAYLVLAYIFNKKPALCQLQPASLLCMILLVYYILRLFSGLDRKLEHLPKPVHRAVGFIAGMTLEIYVVQGEIIDRIRPLFGFPLNWLALTAAILAAAAVLHFACTGIIKLIDHAKPKHPFPH